MEQDKRAVLDLSEGEMEQGGEAPAPGEVAGAEGGLARGAASREQEDAAAMDDAGHGAAGSESNEDDLEDALTEELEGVTAVGNAGHATASGGAKNEDDEVPKNPSATRSKFRWAIANPTPPSFCRRRPLRSRKHSNPTPSIAVGGAALVGGLGLASAMTRSAGASAMTNASQGVKNEAPGSTTKRSELGTTVDESSSNDRKRGTEAAVAAAASLSCRLPSRGRKQRRPDHFVPEGAEVSARAKAHRTNDVLDRYITSLVHASPKQWPEWMRRNITADGVRAQGQRGINGFRTASGGGPGEPDESARILAVLAILGASLALSVVSCVLFYIISQRAEHGPSDKHQKK